MIHFRKTLTRAGNRCAFVFAVLAGLSCADLLGFEQGHLSPDEDAAAGGSGGSPSGGKGGAGGATGTSGGRAGSSGGRDASDEGGLADAGGRGGTSDASRDGVSPPDASIDLSTPDVGRIDASIDGPLVDRGGGGGGGGGGGPSDAPPSDAPPSDAPPNDAPPNDAPPTGCSPNTCPTGCCDTNDVCVTSPTNGACGTGGARCTVCATGQACTQGACRCGPSCTTGCCTSTGECLTPSDQSCGVPGGACTACAKGQTCDATGKCVCNASSCAGGCCDAAGTCVLYAGQTKDKCGTGGAACGTCASGQACGAAGACECTPGSCAGGCCNGTSCLLVGDQGPTTPCGSGGNACGSCAMGQACANGACSCGGVSCAGCCSGGQCQTSDITHCGVGGGLCTACGPKQECNAQGKCVCTAATCPGGCCDATTEECIEPGTNAACGTGGIRCQPCAAGLACTAGECRCTTSSCTGCCNGNTCVGGTAVSACGTGGEICQNCAQGQRCNGTDCICDSTSCSGCCNNLRECKTTSNSTCGSNGSPCSACGPGLECNGTSCVCTPASCQSGCCRDAVTCVPFADQTDTQCGAAKTCGSCAATMQSCNKANGTCTCTAASCRNGCCSGTSCRPYADQDVSACGVSGAPCTTCSSTQKCNGMGACVTKTWCENQTVPAGVALADYQCVDFDNGALPSAWTLTQTGGSTGAISSTQAYSLPNSFHNFGAHVGPAAGTLGWSATGSSGVTRMDLTVDIFRINSKGDPGPWVGYIDMACTGIGTTRACVYYAGQDGFGVTYQTPTLRVPAGRISDLSKGSAGTAGGWSHVELQMTQTGWIDVRVNGVLELSYQTGPGFPVSATGSATVGLVTTSETTSGEFYFDSIVAAAHR